MCGFVDQIALSGDTDCSQNVISSAHDLPDSSFGELIQNSGGTVLEFVFKDNESNKIQPRLCFITFHFLHLHPVDLRNVSRGTCDYSETSMSVICEEVFIITRNWKPLARGLPRE